MRKLGKGQSVVFCVSEEIHSKICTNSDKPHGSEINVADVLLWSISESHADIRRGLPLWAMQGARFEHQRAIWTDVTCSAGLQMPSSQARRFLEKEKQTLEERYRPTKTSRTQGYASDMLFNPANPRLSEIQKRCVMFNALDYKSSALQEEQ